MKYIHLFESFSSLDAEKNWEDLFPEADYDWTAPSGQLYRWLNPDCLYAYLGQADLKWSTIQEYGTDDIGQSVDAKGIPFFDNPENYFGYVEAFIRIILDRNKIESDGYTIFNPRRDPGEVRVREDIKDWLQYLIAIEINRDEFVLLDQEEEREIPIPLKYRMEMWDLIQKTVPSDKIVILNDETMNR
jgi:hypothetical protein